MSKISRREREKLQRKAEIFEAAKKRFFNDTYDNVSMVDIAKDIELSKGTLYLYFDNKASLYFAIVIKGMKILKETLVNAVNKESKGLNKILSIFNAYFDYIEDYSEYYRLNLTSRAPKFTQMLKIKNPSESKITNAKKYIKLTQELFQIVMNAVNTGIKDGSIRSELDPIQTVMFLGAAIEDIVYISPEYQILLDMHEITKKEYLQHSIEIFLKGIAGNGDIN